MVVCLPACFTEIYTNLDSWRQGVTVYRCDQFRRGHARGGQEVPVARSPGLGCAGRELLLLRTGTKK